MPNHYLSEIFPLDYAELNIASFRLSPEVNRKIGNSLGWHLSRQFPDVVVVWEKGYFWILAKPNTEIPNPDNWKQNLSIIQEKHQDKFGNNFYSIQWVNQPQITPSIVSQLAVRVLKVNCRFTTEIVFDENRVQVKRECNFWSETYTANNQLFSAITLHPKSTFLYQETLDIFFENHPFRNKPEDLLLNLKVRDIENNNTATIVGINGTIGEHRERLIRQATGSISKEKLQIAPEEQPVISIQFGQNSHTYDYAMAALRPCVTDKTVAKFDIEYGTLLKQTKITYQARQKLLSQYKQEAETTLIDYGLRFQQRCLNSKHYSNLFWTPENKIEDTLLLFGNGVTLPKNQTLRGLRQGGVYRRHQEFQNLARKIRLGILNLSYIKVKQFFLALEQQLKQYKFELTLGDENIASAILDGLKETKIKVEVEKRLIQIMQVPIDLVLVFLPESDRGKDDSDGNSVYSLVSRYLLRRKIASQVIYQKTLSQNSNHVLNNIVPGILAKLGNLPFVLAEPLSIADYFIGLDISRRPTKNRRGSLNACACVRLYGQRGEFIQYQLADDSLTEGEEIPKRILQDFFPLSRFQNKKVLIYRDGVFRGAEIKNLIAWGKEINTQFILGECAKSQIPRLYNLSNKNLQQPTRGLALKLSSSEVILVTTQVSPKMGVPQPLRLKVKDGENEGISVDIKQLVDTTLKLTLLHHGSLKDPRLPIPLFGADKIAYRRLQGIYPGELEGDKQYWL
ncbi:MAG TPA: Piwi domain-containing protein [Xenococcaceae cyanobacterium]